LPGIAQQIYVHFVQNLARERRQQFHFPLEMSFLILSTYGAAVRTVAKILKMASQAGDICRRGSL
jgi:hypothetical protein